MIFRPAARALTAIITLAAILANATVARADDPLHVAVGQKGGWDTMVTYACVQTGICKKAGLDVSITWTTAGPETAQTVVTGAADIGVAVATPVTFAAFSKGAPIKIIGSEFTGVTDVFWYARTESPIHRMADTAGKRVGFARPASAGDIVVHMLAKQANVEPIYVPTGDAVATRTQVMSNQVDVGWSIPPIDFDLLTQKKIRIIARASDLPALRNEVSRLLIVNANYLATHRDVVVRYMRAYVDTVDWMYAHQDQSIALFAQLNDISPEVAKEALPFYPKAALRATDVPGLQQANTDAAAYNFIDSPLTKEQLGALVDIVYSGR